MNCLAILPLNNLEERKTAGYLALSPAPRISPVYYLNPQPCVRLSCLSLFGTTIPSGARVTTPRRRNGDPHGWRTEYKRATTGQVQNSVLALPPLSVCPVALNTAPDNHANSPPVCTGFVCESRRGGLSVCVWPVATLSIGHFRTVQYGLS